MRAFTLGASAGSAELNRTESRALTVGFVVLLVILAVAAANAIFGIGGTALGTVVREWLSGVVYILVAAIVALRAVRDRTQRRSWALFAAGLSLYGLGNVLWSVWIGRLSTPPIPSISDGLWLTLYPLSYLGIVGFARLDGQRRLPAGVWLDGVIAGGGLAALGATLVFGPILAAAKGSSLAVATELAYPIGDLLLAALVVGVLALRGWRVNRTWGLLGGGFLLLAVADCMYGAQVASGATQPSSVATLFYLLSVTLLAFAAWQREPDRDPSKLGRWSVVVVPAGFTVLALALLLYDRVQRLDPLAFGLAVLTCPQRSFASQSRFGMSRALPRLAERRLPTSSHRFPTGDCSCGAPAKRSPSPISPTTRYRC